VKSFELPEIPYYKLMQTQLNNIIPPAKLEGLTCVDLIVGGNHGGGKF
jgi:hypothetical protein